ncbi:MAG: EthD domain-containing protein [Actinomycetota bacterium]|nr:EthD domain-containing protein [Actinomycetota bacterium]
MPTMIVLVNLKEGVSPEEYERWVLESYAPAVKRLPSVEDWRDYRVSGLLGSQTIPPYRYVVMVEVNDLEQLGQDMASEKMQELLAGLYRLTEVTQIMSDRFV